VKAGLANHALDLAATGVTAFAWKESALRGKMRGESRAATPPQVSAAFFRRRCAAEQAMLLPRPAGGPTAPRPTARQIAH